MAVAILEQRPSDRDRLFRRWEQSEVLVSGPLLGSSHDA
jgi:hypothetical protein